MSKSKRHHTQWAAQFFVGAELSRRGYYVSYTLGNAPSLDLHVTSPRGVSFVVEAKGLKRPMQWLIQKPPKGDNRFYILTLVPSEPPFGPPRYFVLSARSIRRIIYEDPRFPGIVFKDSVRYENRWGILPR